MQSALKPRAVPVSPTLLILFPICFAEEDVENFDVTNLSQDVLRSIEADSFWCMSKLLDGIQVSLWGRREAPPFWGRYSTVVFSLSLGERAPYPWHSP